MSRDITVSVVSISTFINELVVHTTLASASALDWRKNKVHCLPGTFYILKDFQ